MAPVHAQEDDEIGAVEEELPPQEYDVWHMPADYALEVLHGKWQKGEMTMPECQRGHAWSKVQASRLIESFLVGLPVPPVFFFVDKDERLLVIDGMQRLRSIFSFFDGYLEGSDGSRKPFGLAGINEDSRLHAKTFEQLEEDDQQRLRNTALRAILIRQNSPSGDPASIYHIFERLNAGSTRLARQEARHCIYPGKLNDLLAELNRTEAWREIIGNHVPHERKKDVELVLRYMALFHGAREYKKPMTDFLSRFMAGKRNPPDRFLDEERRRFGKTCRVILEKMGSRPFGSRPLMQPVFDAVFVAFARHVDGRCPDDVTDRMRRLLADPQFEESTRRDTADPQKVRARLEIAEKTLFG